MQYHLISIIYYLKKGQKIGCGEIIYCWWEYKMVKPLWKTV